MESSSSSSSLPDYRYQHHPPYCSRHAAHRDGGGCGVVDRDPAKSPSIHLRRYRRKRRKVDDEEEEERRQTLQPEQNDDESESTTRSIIMPRFSTTTTAAEQSQVPKHEGAANTNNNNNHNNEKSRLLGGEKESGGGDRKFSASSSSDYREAPSTSSSSTHKSLSLLTSTRAGKSSSSSLLHSQLGLTLMISLLLKICSSKLSSFLSVTRQRNMQTLFSSSSRRRRCRHHHPSSAKSTVFLIRAATLLSLLLATPCSAGKGVSGFGCSSSSQSSTTLACLPDEYSEYDLPVKGIVYIKVTIDIDEVLRINDKDYSITFSCYFNVEWFDPRIHLEAEFGREQAGPGVNVTNNANIYVPINLEFVKDLWLPNIFIYNLKTYKVIDVLNKLAGLWISASKVVLYSQATHITFICPMRFDKFPLDTQQCKFQVGSYSYDDTKMIFKTIYAGYQAPKTANSIALDYAIEILPLKEQDMVFLGGSLGNFSLAGFDMVLKRYVSTYIITYYLPSGLFVIVSWISFLIPMDVIPGRMALLVTLFLVLVNIFNTVTTNTPKAEGLTAIEAWMLACILFVFGALIEYAAILFKKQRYVSGQHRMNIKIVCKDKFKYEVQERGHPGGHGHVHAPPADNALSMRQLAEEYWRIDKFFLISFPILFFIFNIIYWLAFIL